MSFIFATNYKIN